MSQDKPVRSKMVMFCAFSGHFSGHQRMAGRSSPRQAGIYLIRLISRACFIQTCHRAAIHQTPPAQHAFKRVTPQKLLTHLRITHLWHRFRFIHPQRGINPRQFFSAHPVGQKTKIAHHPEEFLRDMLFHARHNFMLHQGFRCLLTRIVVVVAEAQRRTTGIVCQPGACNRPDISRFFCPLLSFLTYTHASNRRRRSVPGCATVFWW